MNLSGSASKSNARGREGAAVTSVRGALIQMLLPVLLAFLAVSTSFAQSGSSTGTLRGSVTDAQGALIPNATVLVKNTGTDQIRTVKTGPDGTYEAPTLNPGSYSVEVTAPGFSKLVAAEVVISVGQTVAYDAHLNVGSANTVVEVTGNASPLIDAAQTQQANTIDQRQQVNLPNLSRNFAQQLFTLPGVVDSNAPSIQDPNVGTGYQSSGASFGGGNGRGNLFTIDGGENDYGSGAPRVAHVPQDSVQEFQVNRNSFNAEFGFTVGSAINVITKSGTNKFHGSAFGYFHNESTDAANYFNSYGPTAGTKPFEQSAIFGGSLGGFIKKDKLFFFTSYERQKLDSNITVNLLGTAAAQGLLAQTNGFNGTSCPAPVTQACYLAQAEATGNPVLAGVAAGIIGSGALVPVANPQFVNLVAPDSGTFDGNALGAVQAAPGQDGRYNNWVTRLDYTPNEKNTYSLRFSLSRESNQVIGAGGTPRFTSVLQQLRDYTITGNWNHIFNPSLVNTVRVQVVPFNASNNNTPRGGAEFDLGSLGTVGTIFDIPYNQSQNQYQFDDDLSLTKGSHNLKFGGSFRPVQFNIFQAFLFNGDYQFEDGAVPLIDLVPAQYQATFAGFNLQEGYPLLGPTNTNLSGSQLYNIGLPIVLEQGAGNGQYNATSKPFGVYAQDSWKAMRNLTLNYGGRFDYDPIPNNYPTSYFFSPRLGAAWDPFGNGKTIVRAGGGLFTAPELFIVPFTSTVLDGSANHVYATVTTAANAAPQLEGALAMEKSEATAANPNPGLTVAQLATVGINVIPTGPTKVGGAFFTVDPNFKQQYSIQASASVAQELVPNLSVELGYVFYAGVHIQQIQEGNLIQNTAAGTDPFVGPQYAPKPGSTNGEPNSTITQNDETTSAGHSTYSGLTASLTKKYGHGLQFQVNYTWSKAIDNVSDFSSQSTPFRPGLLNLDRAISDFNIKNSLVANAVYTSPNHHAGDRLVRNLYSNFVIAPIVQVRDGVPFTELVPGIGGTQSNGNSSHTNEARPYLEGRNLGIGAGYATFDMRISRGIVLKKDSPFRLDLIAQSSNILNHTNFTSVQNIFPNTATTNAAGVTTSAIVPTPEGNVNLLNGPYNLKGFRPNGALQLSDPLAFKTAAPPRQISFGLEMAF